MPTADLIAEYGPQVPLPPTELEMAEYEQAREREQVTAPAPMPFDRPTQERRARRPSASSRTRPGEPVGTGGVRGPRGATTSCLTQLEDVKAARIDLLDVISEVDARILRVFTEACADVEREFEQVFAFPGGEGRLLYRSGSDMLTTGIEIRGPRPPGKKIKRLSLLSGGEVVDRRGDAGGHLRARPSRSA